MVAVPKAAVRLVLPAAPEATPVVGKTEGVVAEGPSDTAVVAEETRRELSLVQPSYGHHPPTRDEPLLRWVSP